MEQACRHQLTGMTGELVLGVELETGDTWWALANTRSAPRPPARRTSAQGPGRTSAQGPAAVWRVALFPIPIRAAESAQAKQTHCG
jgi:hypothetical protein